MVKTPYKKTRKNKIKNKQTKKIKPMICHPNIDGNTSVGISCLTDKVLFELKESYNKSHPSNIIKHSDPKQIWNELKKNLQCSKEDCWLDTIPDMKIRNKIFKESFAPKQPYDWKYNSKTWLTNYDISAVLKQYEKPYKNFKLIGPTPIDFDKYPLSKFGDCVWEELCEFNLQKYIDDNITKIGIIFNLDEHDKSGSHWVSMFVDLEDKLIFYMDSAGDSIPSEIQILANRIIKQAHNLTSPFDMKLIFNEVPHQKGNSECGVYCLYFIITMLTNKKGNKEFKNLKEKINFFSKKRIPDSYIFKYRKKYFNQ